MTLFQLQTIVSRHAKARQTFTSTKSWTLLVLVCLTVNSSLSAQTAEDIDKAATDLEHKVINWRRQIHQNPELSNREVQTAKLVADHLDALGLEVKTGIGVHGVVAVLKGAKPGDGVVALRADMDANTLKELVDLPFKSTKVDIDWPGGPAPIMHACGHDGHTAMLMGAAEVLSNMRADIAGTVKFIFQGAEEGPPGEEEGGASMMVEQGVLDNPKPDMVFAIHLGPAPNHFVQYTSGNAMAYSYKLSIKIKGVGSHGSAPWTGKDPMPVGAEIISALSQVYRQIPAKEAMTLSIGKVIDEGRFNIIGSNLTLVGTLRVINDDILDDIKMRVDRISTNIAEAHGQTAEVLWEQFVPGVYNDPSWVARMLPTIEKVVGAQNIAVGPASLGYDDASEFINPIGGMYISLGAQDTEFGGPTGIKAQKGGKGMHYNHSPHFYLNEQVLITGVKLHVNMVFDFLNGDI
jgi:amidohydrolase